MKKTLAIILSIVMAISMLPLGAFAYDGTVKDIDLTPREPYEVFFETGGYWDTDSEDEKYYWYNGFIGRGTGDVFTITDENDAQHSYTCVYRDGDYILVDSESGDEINYNEVQMINEQDRPGKHFTLGDENYFTIEFRGVRKDIPVSVIENPVEAINFVPVDGTYQRIKETGGHWDTDKNGEEFYYYTPEFRSGDQLEVTFAGDEEPTVYTYRDGSNGHGFFDDNDEILYQGDGIKRLYTSRDSYAHWTVEDGGVFTVRYFDRECEVEVEIIENPVTAIEYQRNGKDEFVEGDTRYDENDGNSYYQLDNFREGDVLIVFEGDESTRYTCVWDEDEWDYVFESEDGESMIETGWEDGQIHLGHNQREKAWTLGNQNEFYAEYMGRTYTLYATVKENPVESISYTRARAQEYLFEVDGYEWDEIFEYNLNNAETGDVLSVKFKDKAKAVDYTYKWNDEEMEWEFVAENGDVISREAVNFYADQRNHPWTLGSNPYTVSYSGKSVTLYASVIVDPVDYIEFTRSRDVVEILEGTDGWEDGEGNWIYDTPWFEYGDALTVHYKEGQPKTFTYNYYEEPGYSCFKADDGEVLNGVDFESNQSDTPWTVGDNNEYYVVYHGKKSAPLKVTIKKNTVTGIDFIRANPIVIYADDTKEIYYPPEDETFEGYDIPFFEAGDKLIVHDSEAGDKEYVLTFNEEDREYYFVCGNDVLARDAVNVYDNQYESPWSVDGLDNYFFVSYLGQTTKVPVTIIESDVESIEYTVADPDRLVLIENSDKNGSWGMNWGINFFYYYRPDGYLGDTLTVNYKNGTSSVYTVKFDGTPGGIGIYLENDEGERIAKDEVVFFDNQYDNHWYPDEDNYYYVKYKGVSASIPVTIAHDYEKEVIAPTCVDEGYTRYTCRACGEEYEDDFVKPTGKHISDKGTVTTKPTYTKEGVKTYKCTVCGKKLKTEKIAKLEKKANTIKASGKTVNLKLKDVKKKAQTVKKSKAYSISKAKGTVTFAKSSGNKAITVDKKSGSIKVKKGLKKGTYKVKIKVKAAGTTEYKSKTVTVTVKVVIK